MLLEAVDLQVIEWEVSANGFLALIASGLVERTSGKVRSPFFVMPRCLSSSRATRRSITARAMPCVSRIRDVLVERFVARFAPASLSRARRCLTKRSRYSRHATASGVWPISEAAPRGLDICVG